MTHEAHEAVFSLAATFAWRVGVRRRDQHSDATCAWIQFLLSSYLRGLRVFVIVPGRAAVNARRRSRITDHEGTKAAAGLPRSSRRRTGRSKVVRSAARYDSQSVTAAATCTPDAVR